MSLAIIKERLETYQCRTEQESLNLWSQEFFLDRLDKIRGYLDTPTTPF